MKPDISVIIPTYKRQDSLEKLLDCLFLQEEVKLEIVLIDQNPIGFFSGSLAEVLKKIKYNHQESPNASTARNSGYNLATADHLLFIDDDLVPESTFCRDALQIFRSNPRLACFVPLVYTAEGKEVSLNKILKVVDRNYRNEPGIYRIDHTMSAAVFFKREYFGQTGGFDPYLFDYAKTAEDQEFFLRMKMRQMNVWLVPAISVFHDEGIPGGCELRSSDYWVTRKKCIQSWVYRYRIHNKKPGALSLVDFLHLCRSVFLNREVISSHPGYILRHIRMLVGAIAESKEEFQKNRHYYSPAVQVNYL